MDMDEPRVEAPAALQPPQKRSKTTGGRLQEDLIEALRQEVERLEEEMDTGCTIASSLGGHGAEQRWGPLLLRLKDAAAAAADADDADADDGGQESRVKLEGGAPDASPCPCPHCFPIATADAPLGESQSQSKDIRSNSNSSGSSAVRLSACALLSRAEWAVGTLLEAECPNDWCGRSMRRHRASMEAWRDQAMADLRLLDPLPP